MKISLQLPVNVVEPAGEFQSAAAVREMAGALERSGAGACWVTDHPAPTAKWLAGGHDALDPFTALAFAAAATSTLKLHVNIVVLPYRNPFITAKAAATLDVLSGGRLILGAAGGYLKGEFFAVGADFASRGALSDEALETIRMAWSGKEVTKEGRHFNARGILPRPAPSPNPPIWIGGGSEKAMERAIKWGDGWSPFFSAPGLSQDVHQAIETIEQLRSRLAQLRTRLKEAGRTGPFDICLNTRHPPKAATKEDAQKCLEELGELKESGVTWVATEVPHPSRKGFLENVQWYGEEVIGKLA